ncbi:hypothetical protein ACFL1H_00080 [Nanoarchaeota archaeon]
MKRKNELANRIVIFGSIILAIILLSSLSLVLSSFVTFEINPDPLVSGEEISGNANLNFNSDFYPKNSLIVLTIDDLTSALYLWDLIEGESQNGTYGEEIIEGYYVESSLEEIDLSLFNVNAPDEGEYVLTLSIVYEGDILDEDSTIVTVEPASEMPSLTVPETPEEPELPPEPQIPQEPEVPEQPVNETEEPELPAQDPPEQPVNETQEPNETEEVVPVDMGIIVPDFGVQALPTYSNFDGNTTDFSAVLDIEDVLNAVLEVDGIGKIMWTTDINASGADFDSYVTISDNHIMVDIINLDSSMNNTAEITFYTISQNYDNPTLYWDQDDNGEYGQCEDCIFLSDDGQNITYFIPHFTSFKIGESTYLEIWDQRDPEGGSQVKHVNDSVIFYSNFSYTNTTAIVNDSGSGCNITFKTSGSYGLWDIMTFNATSDLYEYSRNFTNSELVYYNVSCYDNETETLEEIDSIQIGDLGNYTIDIITPFGTDFEAAQNEFFEFTINVTCNALCGQINLTLDPFATGGNFNVSTKMDWHSANSTTGNPYDARTSGGFQPTADMSGGALSGDIGALANTEPIIHNVTIETVPVFYNALTYCKANVSDLESNINNVRFNLSSTSREFIINGTLVNDWYQVNFFANETGNWTCDVIAYDAYGLNDTYSVLFNVSDKYDVNNGVVPVGSGNPFYTNESNPQSCFLNETDTFCSITWWVNATGELYTTFEFFIIGEGEYEDRNSSKINVTIKGNAQPTLNDISMPSVIEESSNFTITAIGANDFEQSNLTFICSYDSSPNMTNTICNAGTTFVTSPPYDLTCNVTADSDHEYNTTYCLVYDGGKYSTVVSDDYIDNDYPTLDSISLVPSTGMLSEFVVTTSINANDASNDQLKIKCGTSSSNYDLCESTLGAPQRSCTFNSPWSDNSEHEVYCIIEDEYSFTSFERNTKFTADNIAATTLSIIGVEGDTTSKYWDTVNNNMTVIQFNLNETGDVCRYNNYDRTYSTISPTRECTVSGTIGSCNAWDVIRDQINSTFIYVSCNDQYNNEQNISINLDVYLGVDWTKPTVTTSNDGDIYLPGYNVTFNITDVPQGTYKTSQYCVDSDNTCSPSTEIQTSENVTFNTRGVWYLRYNATDEALNRNETKATIVFINQLIEISNPVFNNVSYENHIINISFDTLENDSSQTVTCNLYHRSNITAGVFTSKMMNLTNGISTNGTFTVNLSLSDSYSISEPVQFYANCSDTMEDVQSDMYVYQIANREPVQSSLLPNQTWKEDESLIINLSEYLIDLDGDAVTFNSSGTTNINVVITNEMANLTPIDNWFGIEYVTFGINDTLSTSNLSNLVKLTVYSVPDIYMSTYSGTDFEGISETFSVDKYVKISTVLDYIQNVSAGNITFLDPITFDRDLNIDYNVSINYNSITIDSTGAPELNEPAEITFVGVTEIVVTPWLYKDGVRCDNTSDCSFVSMDLGNDIFKFNVTSFSTYHMNNSNYPPTMGAVQVIPSTAYIHNDYNCSAIASDGEQSTLSYYFTWYIDSVQNTTWDTTVNCANGTICYTDTLIPSYAIKHFENLTCEVYANDLTFNSSKNSDSITILNSQTTFDFNLANQSLFNNANLTYDINCSDNDTDTITYYDDTILFDINSSTGLIEDDPDVIETGNYSITITCSDSYINTTQSFVYEIRNRIPTTTNLILNSTDDPLNRTRGNLYFYYTYNDNDNNAEVTKIIKWYRDDLEIDYLENLTTIANSSTLKGQTWIASISVFDGFEWSVFGNSSSITIENTAPVFSVPLQNQSVYHSDELYYTISCDDEDTADTMIYYDNSPMFDIHPLAGAMNDNPNQSEVGVYNIIINCSDGMVNATDNFNYTILNYIPESQNLIISNSDSLNRTNGDIISYYEYYDNDNDPKSDQHIIWYLNDTLQPSLENLTSIPNTQTTKADNWKFAVRVNDGLDWSQFVNSSSIQIVNAAPYFEIDNRTMDEDSVEFINLTFKSDDYDGDNLVWTVIQENTSEADCNIVSDNLSIIPPLNWFGIASCTINVTDGESTNQSTFYINVTNVNDPPSTVTLTNPIEMFNTSNYFEMFNWTIATDVDPDTLTYYLIIDNSPTFTSTDSNSSTLNLYYYENLTELTDNIYYWKIIVCDDGTPSLCNSSTTNRTMNIDRTAPDITIDNPQTDNKLGYNVNLQNTIADNTAGAVGVDQAWYLIYNSTGSLTSSGTLSGPSYDSVWATTLNNPPDDYYTLIVYANDTLGNEDNESVSFYLDNTVPAINIIYPNNINLTNDFNIDVRLSNLMLDYSYYNITNSTGYNLRSNITYNINAVEYNWTDFAEIISWNDDIYNITVFVKDVSGNNNTQFANFIIDQTPPKYSGVVTTTPIYNDVNVNLNVTWTDNLAGIKNVTIETNASGIWESTLTLYNSGSEYYIIIPSSALENQEVVGWRSYSYDTAGNYNETPIYAFQVQNRMPNVTSTFITTDDTLNRTLANLTSNYVYYDIDGDAENMSYIKWYLNNTEITALENSSTVLNTFTTKHDRWILSVKVHDGLVWSTWLNSSEVIINNYLPFITNVILNATDHPFNKTDANLDIYYLYNDYDNDPESDYHIIWYLNESIQLGLENQTIILDENTTKHDIWKASISVFDNEEWSLYVNSSIIQILNTAPIHTTPTITPNPAYRLDNLLCNNHSTFDQDNDPVTNNYRWFRNNTLLAETSNTLPTGNFEYGDYIICEITPFDQEEYGVPKNSSAIMIQNHAPLLTAMIMQPTAGRNNTYVNLTSYNATDVDLHDLTLMCGNQSGTYNLCTSTAGQPQRECQFNTIWTDDIPHSIYCVVNDGIENSNEIEIAFLADNTAPIMDTNDIIKLDSDYTSPYWDAVNNGFTKLYIQGEINMDCRWNNSDISYGEMLNATECTMIDENTTCNFGNLVQASAYPGYYIACQDQYGNQQNSTTNINIPTFGVDWTDPNVTDNINETYLYTPLFNVTMYEDDYPTGTTVTTYCCEDTTNSCTPNIACDDGAGGWNIVNFTFTTSQRGVRYLRYYGMDEAGNTQTLVSRVVNVKEGITISSYEYIDYVEHVFNVKANASQPDQLAITCNLWHRLNNTGGYTSKAMNLISGPSYNGTYSVNISNSDGYSTFDIVEMYVNCIDPTENFNGSLDYHQIPDIAPYVPDLTYPFNNTYIYWPNITLRFNSSDIDLDTVTYYVFGDTVDATTLIYSGTNDNYLWDPGTGTYLWKVIAGDLYLNSSASDIHEFTLNTTDSIPPTTTDNSTDNWQTWFVNNIVIALNASDYEFGVNHTMYCVDYDYNAGCTPNILSPDNFTSLTISCAANEACVKYVRYYSVDYANNTETTQQSLPIYINGADGAITNSNSTDCVLKNTINMDNSDCQNSYKDDVTMQNSVDINSSVKSSTEIDCNIIRSDFNYSYCQNSNIYDSDIIFSGIINSIMDNMTLIDANYSDSNDTNSVQYSGTLIVDPSILFNNSYYGDNEVYDSNVSNSILNSSIIVNSDINFSYLAEDSYIYNMTIFNLSIDGWTITGSGYLIYNGTTYNESNSLLDIFCGDGIYNYPNKGAFETCNSCPADVGACPVESRGGGGGPTVACKPDWNCSDWGDCSAVGEQTRTCTDANGCSRTNYKVTYTGEGDVFFTEKDILTMVETRECTPYVGESCHDQKMNQDETDIDCGGIRCKKCGIGMNCLTRNDCTSLLCENNKCIDEDITKDYCNDGILNLEETSIDCGGACGDCEIIIQGLEEEFKTNTSYTIKVINSKDYLVEGLKLTITLPDGSLIDMISNDQGELSLLITQSGNVNLLFEKLGHLTEESSIIVEPKLIDQPAGPSIFSRIYSAVKQAANYIVQNYKITILPIVIAIILALMIVRIHEFGKLRSFAIKEFKAGFSKEKVHNHMKRKGIKKREFVERYINRLRKKKYGRRDRLRKVKKLAEASDDEKIVEVKKSKHSFDKKTDKIDSDWGKFRKTMKKELKHEKKEIKTDKIKEIKRQIKVKRKKEKIRERLRKRFSRKNKK